MSKKSAKAIEVPRLKSENVHINRRPSEPTGKCDSEIGDSCGMRGGGRIVKVRPPEFRPGKKEGSYFTLTEVVCCSASTCESAARSIALARGKVKLERITAELESDGYKITSTGEAKKEVEAPKPRMRVPPRPAREVIADTKAPMRPMPRPA